MPDNIVSGKEERTVLYICPNGCEEEIFFQDGTLATSEIVTETGEHMEYDHFDFNPTGPVKCRECRAKATIRAKITKTVVTIE